MSKYAILLKIVLAILAFIAIVTLFRQMVGEWNFWNGNLVTTTGKVVHVEVSTSTDSDDNTYTCDNPTIQFRRQNGEVVEFEPRLSSCSYQVGDQVTVIYDPQNPQNARVDLGDASNGFWHILLTTGPLECTIMVIGAIFLSLLLSIFVSLRKYLKF